MLKILWVEDDPEDFAKVIFNADHNEISLKKVGVTLAKNYLAAIDFIENDSLMQNYDIIILDVKFDAWDKVNDKPLNDNPKMNNLLSRFRDWHGYIEGNSVSLRNAKIEFEGIAGYHLYLELVLEYGFPANRIFFASNHLGHLRDLKDNLSKAKISLETHSKNESDIEKIKLKLKLKSDDFYISFRRAIIDLTGLAIKSINSKEWKNNVFFLAFLKDGQNFDEVHDNLFVYLYGLQQILPIKQPKDEHSLQLIILQFIKALSAPWEDKAQSCNLRDHYSNSIFNISENYEILRTLGFVMKSLRNRVSHNKIHDFINLGDAFILFIIGMGSMFKVDISKYIPESEFTINEENLKNKLIIDFENIFLECISQCNIINKYLTDGHRFLKPNELDLNSDQINYLKSEKYYNNLIHNLGLGDHKASLNVFVKILWQGLFGPEINTRMNLNQPERIFYKNNYFINDSLNGLGNLKDFIWLERLLKFEGGKCFDR